VLLGVIGVLLAIVINPTSRNAIALGYKMIFKMLTGFFITLDPIIILKDYVQQLYANLEEMSQQIGRVKGTLQGLKVKITEYSKEANEEMEKAKFAKNKGDTKTAQISHRKAVRRQESIQKLSALYAKIEMILRVLHKMHENCNIVADDTKDSVEMKQDEWEAVKSANSAMKSAMSVISGGGDKRATFEQAMEYLIDDVSLKMGEMQNFMDMTEGLMSSIDLNNEMFDEKMLANLEAWEQKSDSWILGDEKTTITSGASNVTDTDFKMGDMKVKIFG
jgi:phage shock protein A